MVDVSSKLSPSRSPAAQRPVVEPRLIEHLRPYPKNARKHSKKQIRQIADSIRAFGFTNPVLIDRDGVILAGHARVEAAKLIGMTEIPTICLPELNGAKRRAYVITDNKLGLNAGWDYEILASELKAIDAEFEVELTGFSLAEADLMIDGHESGAAAPSSRKKVPDRAGPIVSRAGDEWAIGEHRLLCGANDGLCDEIVRFFEQTSGQEATLADTGQSFSALARLRGAETAR